jgi:hypothetical protein
MYVATTAPNVHGQAGALPGLHHLHLHLLLLLQGGLLLDLPYLPPLLHLSTQHLLVSTPAAAAAAAAAAEPLWHEAAHLHQAMQSGMLAAAAATCRGKWLAAAQLHALAWHLHQSLVASTAAAAAAAAAAVELRCCVPSCCQ